MKLKNLAKIMLVSCSILALGACSSTKHPSSTSMGSGGPDGAEATGIGEGENFGPNGGGREHAQGKNTYYFDYDRSDIHDQDKPAILANANKLVAHPGEKMIVEGHTDPRGSREYNVALAERRANAVAELMRSKGVSSSQTRVVSYGAERLAAPGHNEEDYQLDRRAVLADQQG